MTILKEGFKALYNVKWEICRKYRDTNTHRELRKYIRKTYPLRRSMRFYQLLYLVYLPYI